MILVSTLDYANIDINCDAKFTLLVDSISSRVLEFIQVDEEFLIKFESF
jgi:hypothetical protein